MKKLFLVIGLLAALIGLMLFQSTKQEPVDLETGFSTTDLPPLVISDSDFSDSTDDSTIVSSDTIQEEDARLKEVNRAFVTAFYLEDMAQRTEELEPLLTEELFHEYGEFEQDLDASSTSEFEGFTSFFGEQSEETFPVVNLVSLHYEGYSYTIVLQNTLKKVENTWRVSEITVQLINPATTN